MLPSYENSRGSNGPNDTRPFPKAPVLGGQSSTASHDNDDSGSWNTGLFDCLHDPNGCIITAFCPCYTFGQIADIVDRGDPGCVASGAIEMAIFMCVGPLHWLYPLYIRLKLRREFGIQSHPISDFLAHFFCGAFALCQEYRELKTRGFDLDIGWRGNMERQNQGITMPPYVNSMTR